MDEILQQESGLGYQDSQTQQRRTDSVNTVGAANEASIGPKPGKVPLEKVTPVFALDKIKAIRVELRAVLGRARLPVSQLVALKSGDLITLDTNVGDEIELYANGCFIGFGEIVVLETQHPSFGVTLKRLAERQENSAELLERVSS